MATCPKGQWRGQTQNGTFSLYCKSLDDTISLVDLGGAYF